MTQPLYELEQVGIRTKLEDQIATKRQSAPHIVEARIEHVDQRQRDLAPVLGLGLCVLQELQHLDQLLGVAVNSLCIILAAESSG